MYAHIFIYMNELLQICVCKLAFCTNDVVMVVSYYKSALCVCMSECAAVHSRQVLHSIYSGLHSDAESRNDLAQGAHPFCARLTINIHVYGTREPAAALFTASGRVLSRRHCTALQKSASNPCRLRACTATIRFYECKRK